MGYRVPSNEAEIAAMLAGSRALAAGIASLGPSFASSIDKWNERRQKDKELTAFLSTPDVPDAETFGGPGADFSQAPPNTGVTQWGEEANPASDRLAVAAKANKGLTDWLVHGMKMNKDALNLMGYSEKQGLVNRLVDMDKQKAARQQSQALAATIAMHKESRIASEQKRMMEQKAAEDAAKLFAGLPAAQPFQTGPGGAPMGADVLTGRGGATLQDILSGVQQHPYAGLDPRVDKLAQIMAGAERVRHEAGAAGEPTLTLLGDQKIPVLYRPGGREMTVDPGYALKTKFQNEMELLGKRNDPNKGMFPEGTTFKKDATGLVIATTPDGWMKPIPHGADNILRQLFPQLGGGGDNEPQPNISEADYAKLNKGDKFWWNGKEHTKQ